MYVTVPLYHCSVGSQGETSFEEGVFGLLGVKPHTFDPYLPPSRLKHTKALTWLHFHEWGLGAERRERRFDMATGRVGELRPLEEVMAELGHEWVDVLKLDCEGCEGPFVAHLGRTTSRERPLFGQLLMELHR